MCESEGLMGKISTPEMAGSVVRRVREDRGMSRDQLARATGVGARTLYALETGESENIGLGKFLKVLAALDLSMSLELDGLESPRRCDAANGAGSPAAPLWDDLADIWKLDDGGAR